MAALLQAKRVYNDMKRALREGKEQVAIDIISRQRSEMIELVCTLNKNGGRRILWLILEYNAHKLFRRIIFSLPLTVSVSALCQEPVMWRDSLAPPIWHASRGHSTIDIVQMLLNAQVDVNCKYDGITPLLLAIREGTDPAATATLFDLLVSNGAEVSSSTSYGVTTLMMAARVCPSLVSKVMDNIKKAGQEDLDVFVNKLDYAGHAAVHYAIIANIDASKQTLCMLKEANACMQVRNDVDECALLSYATAALDEGCAMTEIWDTVRALVGDVYINNEWIFFELYGAWLVTKTNYNQDQQPYAEPWKLALSLREQASLVPQRPSIAHIEVQEPTAQEELSNLTKLQAVKLAISMQLTHLGAKSIIVAQSLSYLGALYVSENNTSDALICYHLAQSSQPDVKQLSETGHKHKHSRWLHEMKAAILASEGLLCSFTCASTTAL
jgi:hypothetical protein